MFQFLPTSQTTGRNWNITPDCGSPHVSSRTKAIIVVQVFGLNVRVEDFREFGIPIIGSIPYDPQLEAAFGDVDALRRTELYRSMAGVLGNREPIAGTDASKQG